MWNTQHPLKASAKVASFSVHHKRVVNHLRPWHRLHHTESFISVQRIHFRFLHRLQNTDPLQTRSPFTSDFRAVAPCRVLHKRIAQLPRSGEMRTQKSKSHLMRTQSLSVLPLKPGVGQYIAMHSMLTARDFYLFPSFRSNYLHFFPKKTLPIFLCWLWLTHGSCVGPQNKIGNPAECRFPCLVPAEYK